DADARFLDSRSYAVQAGVQPDRRDHDFIVDELLDALQSGLASLRIQFPGLLGEETVDVRIAAVDIGAATGDEGLDSRGGAAVRGARALDDALVLFFGPSLEEGCPLDRTQPHANPGGVEVVDHGLADERDRCVAEVVSGVEAVGIASLGEELLGARRIVRVAGWLPVELEAARNDAPGDLGKSERVRLIHRLPVDGV